MPSRKRSKEKVDSLIQRSSSAPQVLVAEDCSDMADLLMYRFEEAGAEVVTAEDGEECVALALMAQEAMNPFDLVTADLGMPLLDGFEVAKLMRSGGYEGPIICITANPTRQNTKEAIKSGFTSLYGKKYLNREVLQSLVENLASGKTRLS